MARNRKRRRPFIRSFLSQNVRGLKSGARLTELLDTLSNRRYVVACIQETWRTGAECFREDGHTFIGSGLVEPVCKRGSQGVAILLGEEGTQKLGRTPDVKSITLLGQDASQDAWL